MAIAVDTSTESSAASGAGPFTWSHTCTGSNLVLVVLVKLNGGGTVRTVTGITYNGVSLTHNAASDKSFAADSLSSEIWYLANPATGANTISVSIDAVGNASFGGGAVSFSGANVSSVPDGDGGNAAGSGSGAISDSATTSFANTFLVDIAGSNSSNASTPTSSTSTVQQTFINNANSGNMGIGTLKKVVAGAQAMAWNLGVNADYTHSIIGIREFVASAASASGTNLLTLLGVG